MIESSQNFLEEILTRNFLGIEVVLKLSLFAHWRWWWVAYVGKKNLKKVVKQEPVVKRRIWKLKNGDTRKIFKGLMS